MPVLLKRLRNKSLIPSPLKVYLLYGRSPMVPENKLKSKFCADFISATMGQQYKFLTESFLRGVAHTCVFIEDYQNSKRFA
jgi:hypothetical protein